MDLTGTLMRVRTKLKGSKVPDSQVYKLAGEIGKRANDRLRLAVIILTLVVVLTNVVAVAIFTFQAQELHDSTKNGQRLIAALLSEKTAHATNLSTTGLKGIRCVLTINPKKRTYAQEQALINHCFAKFDALDP